MLLTPEILTIDILNVLFLCFATIAFILSLQIVFKFDANATTPLQYSLEKKSYLGSTIIKYMFYLKIPLFLFFIFTLDKLSLILPGAMCAAGVVNANEYATPLIFLKILNLYLFAYWIVLDSEDMKEERQPYLKKKFTIFIGLFVLLVIEIILESIFFGSINVEKVVDCCGVIFSKSNGTYISYVLNLSPALLLSLFYLNYILMWISSLMKQYILFSLLNLFFIIISLISLIAFFGTYIYELPTHHCPFCMLQKEYHYVGYFLYAFLFIGTFNGLVLGFMAFKADELKSRIKKSLGFNLSYLLIVSLYPVAFYIKNGVWL